MEINNTLAENYAETADRLASLIEDKNIDACIRNAAEDRYDQWFGDVSMYLKSSHPLAIRLLYPVMKKIEREHPELLHSPE
jgi:hypothetical protein